MKTPYTFSVLRYVHDPVSTEFVNIGVAVYAPAAKYLSALCTTHYLNSPEFYTLQVGKCLVDSFQDTFLKLGKLDNTRDLKGVALVSEVNLVH